MKATSESMTGPFCLLLLPLLGCAMLFALQASLEVDVVTLWAVFFMAGAAWALALFLARKGAGSLPVVIAGAIVLRAITLGADPGLSDDNYRYVWEGEVVRAGYSPYALAPTDPALEELRALYPAIHAGLNNADVSAAYPPVTQWTFAGLAALGDMLNEGQDGTPSPAPDTFLLILFRAAFVIFDLLVLWPLIRMLRRRGLPPALSVAYAWSPLVMLEFAGSGHFDSLGILLLVAAIDQFDAAGESGRKSPRLGLGASIGYVLAMLAVLVKLLPVVVLPAVWRGPGVLRRIILCSLLCLAFASPMLWLQDSSSGLGHGVGEYGLRWEWASLTYRFIEIPFGLVFENDRSWHDARLLARLFVGGIWLAAGAYGLLRGFGPLRLAGWLIAWYLVLTPTLHPWYVTWMVPFLALRPSRAWIWLCATVSLSYMHLFALRADPSASEPYWIWPLIALPFFALLILDGRRPLVGGIKPAT